MPESLEKKLGYSFNNKKLLEQALTHSSFSNEQGSSNNYERMEFLGDAVLELVVSELLFTKYLDMSEGDLTKKRASMVCEESLAIIAKRLEIGKYLHLGNGEEATGGRDRNSILADALEAIFGGIYIDGGMDLAKKTIHSLMDDSAMKNSEKFIKSDYKTQLQELIQEYSTDPIIYELINESGPDHAKTFETRVLHKDEVLGAGIGKSKKESEQNAALSAIKKMKK